MTDALDKDKAAALDERLKVTGPSQMTNGEVEAFFRKAYNDYIGKGFVDGATLARLQYEWFFGSPGQAWMDFMQSCGGDANNPRPIVSQILQAQWIIDQKVNAIAAKVGVSVEKFGEVSKPD